ncbi:hypothetical protein [Mycoplasmopsis lipofaciens]|uniref:hypothetical protein n=1 Tax=Mycoplasmopsis lipofaciens TaxID=114884 RepID=UPI000482D909|nr:hypothetical protein [Mycoplasmopsis lipofaciens]
MKAKNNYLLELKYVKPTKSGFRNETIIDNDFHAIKSEDILELLILQSMNFNKRYGVKYDWVVLNKNNIKKFENNNEWKIAGKIKFDVITFESKTYDDLKQLTSRFLNNVNKEILFYEQQREEMFMEWKDFAQKHALKIANRVFEEKGFKYNFNFSELSNRYVYSNFELNKKELKFMPYTSCPLKEMSCDEFAELEIATVIEQNEKLAILKCNDFQIKTPITDNEYAILNDEIDSFEKPEHEWVIHYGYSSSFNKKIVKEILQEKYIRYYYGMIKNKCNFSNDKITRFDFYLKTENLIQNSETMDYIGFVELNTNEIKEENINFIMDNIKKLIVIPLRESIKNANVLNKYEIVDFINKNMDKIYKKYMNII